MNAKPLHLFVFADALGWRLAQRRKFLAEEWPRIHATIQRLGLTPEELLAAATTAVGTRAEEGR